MNSDWTMDSPGTPTKKSKLTLYIIIALIIGIALGFALNKSYLAEENNKLTALDVSIEQLKTEIQQATDSSSLGLLKASKKSLGKERNAVLSSRESVASFATSHARASARGVSRSFVMISEKRDW